MSKVKIRSDSIQGCGVQIEVDGKPVTAVTSLNLAIKARDLNRVSITRFDQTHYAEPDIEIEAEVDIANVCPCCGQENPKPPS